MSTAAWRLSANFEARTRTDEFTTRANNNAATLQRGINDYWDKLRSVRSLFESSSGGVTREEFEIFANSLLDSRSAIMNVAWLPRIKEADRPAHELAGRSEGVSGYEIRDIKRDGTLQRAPEQLEYFPKFYSTESRDSEVYGLDLNDGGEREKTLGRSRDNNTLSTSPPLMLLIGEGNRLGFWAVIPVYTRRSLNETTDDRRRNLIGFVQGVFQVGVMIDAKLQGLKSPVLLYLFAPNAAEHEAAIYAKSGSGIISVEAKSQAALTTGVHKSFPVELGDALWMMVITPDVGGIPTANAYSLVILACGLTMSLALTLFIWATRRGSQKLEEQNLRFDAALNNMGQGLLMYGSDGRLMASNRRMAELFGVEWVKWKTALAETTVPQAMQVVSELTGITEIDPERIIAKFNRIMETGVNDTILFERTDGRTFSAFCAPMPDGRSVITFDDITARRRADERISHLAHFDTLTDLPNRVLFYDKMEQLLNGISRGHIFAILSVDLDDFKNINDTLGHPVGDKLLQLATKRMRGCVRESDMVARVGGDEFIIVQVAVEQPSEATSLALRLIDTVGAPYQIDNNQVVIGVSIGIAIGPTDGATPDQLVKNSDLALYHAKSDGGKRYQFYKHDMHVKRQEFRALHLDLHNALAKCEFALHYQPIVDLESGKIIACEALIRWKRKGHAYVSPLEFIPVAEQTGLIVPIGEWVLKQACTEAAQWPEALAVAVNVSPAQFNTDFLGVVTKVLQASGLPASRLELEITELFLLRDNSAAFELLHQLKALGISIAMDDFGTGYSSLGYLRSFPFDRVKIDQSFIRGLSKDRHSVAIIRAVIGLGHSLGFVTTAEGVETQQQLDLLRTEGCTQAQGYLLGTPKPAVQIRALLAKGCAGRRSDTRTFVRR